MKRLKKSEKLEKFTVSGIEPTEFEVDKTNAYPIYYKKVPWSTAVHIRFMFMFGAKDDVKGKEGVAHFLEHMLFDGSNTFADRHAVDDFSALYALNSLNASTGYHQFNIVSSCLPEHFETVSNAMSDMLINPKLREEDVEHERKVITQEIWGKLLNPKYIEYTKKSCANTLRSFPDRQRASRALGWPETVAKITRKDLVTMHKKYVGTSNLTIFVTGAVDKKHITHIKKLLKLFPKGTKAVFPKSPKKILPPKENLWTHTYSEIGRNNRKQVDLSISSITPKSSLKDSAANVILRGLLYELLHKKIRLDNSWCYSVSASSSISSDLCSHSISSTIDPDFTEEARKEMLNVIDSIVSGEKEKEFNIAKNTLLDKIKATEFTSGTIMQSATSDFLTYRKIITITEEIAAYKKVTYKDVRNLAARAFDPNITFTEIVRPDTE